MLDKSIPYYNVLMLRKANTPLCNYSLPHGYLLRTYQLEDEKSWAQLLTDVGEFDSPNDALAYFNTHYAPHLEELKRRMLFICDESGTICATYTNWWNTTHGKRDPSVHWLATSPQHQGKGLAKYLVCEGSKRLITLEGEGDYALHTQTWSYKAIGIYQLAGYGLSPDVVFSNYNNEFNEALPLLKSKMTTQPKIVFANHKLLSLNLSNITYKPFTLENTHDIGSIDASDYIKKAWRIVNGSLRLVTIDYFDPTWPNGYDAHHQELVNTVKGKGLALGAYYQDDGLIGMVTVNAKLFGKRYRYLLLDNMFISRSYRGLGLGRELFKLACGFARDKGADKLYICAGSSESTIAFYHRLGCTPCLEIQQHLYDNDPRDIQLEYIL